ncbi:hypothetical protein O181_121923 [Austropuccinia psidii MF-1]|uniref:Uncharacterized protein n=1 Tax=Austropuccinia psidii MF-1 TaxID=1389203 RepID=A0A9Q3KIF5_9BASI|nr:hypothetical protein [Austropuccinia psidii MF-1]
MEIDRRKNLRFSEWEPGSGTPETYQSEPEETKTPILGLSSSELQNFSIQLLKLIPHKKSVAYCYKPFKINYRITEIEFQSEEPWLRDYKENIFFLIDSLLYHRERHTSALTVIDRDHF